MKNCQAKLKEKPYTSLPRLTFRNVKARRPLECLNSLDNPTIYASTSRRTCLFTTFAAIALPATATAEAEDTLQQQRMTKSTYSLDLSTSTPIVSWEQKSKAGADTYFEDTNNHSTNLGVTLLPVMIKSLSDFGDLNKVGNKLMDTEKAKESTLGVDMITQQQRRLKGKEEEEEEEGPLTYDFEYELNSTRGRKRIFSTVTVTGGQLIIVNGNYKCPSKETCDPDNDVVDAVRRATQSLQLI